MIEMDVIDCAENLEGSLQGLLGCQMFGCSSAKEAENAGGLAFGAVKALQALQHHADLVKAGIEQ